MLKKHRFYEWAKLDKETTFSFLTNQLRCSKRLVQFVLCRQLATYGTVLEVIVDCENKSAILQENSKEVVENIVIANKALQNEVGKVHILKSQGERSFHIEKKVDRLADQRGQLSLIVKMKTTRL